MFRFLIGLLCLPLGMAARVITNVVLEPDFGPGAVYYDHTMIFVVLFHLIVLVAAIVALITRFRRPILNRVVLFSLIGYGMMGALLKLALY